ncbi:MAG: ATP-dependent Clp protease ATP-binding subunit, partial [Ruminococcaceae bacterium]|nr:ATP-dependent Clp protease ATP-binding subunit [Oscillospiraceae bacterium]
MEMCARCHKRVAVVYVTKIENGNTVTEGICLKCARELGIKPVNDILTKMGVPEDAIDELDQEIQNLENNAENAVVADPDSGEAGTAPAINLSELFQNFGFGKPQNSPSDKEKSNEPPHRDQKKREPKLKYLSTYCRNLTASAMEGKLDRIVGRDRELSRVIQILSRRQKNNPCLIGEPGVGKTAIAEALALRIADGNVPTKLRGKQIYLVDLTALVAGTQFRGQFESRIQGLIGEVKEVGNAILVIDEVHNIVGAGEAEGAMNAANILKPALSRGEIQVIGATTMNEYRKYIEKDSALERRFQPVIVGEPSIEDSVEILRGIKHYYEEFHGVTISDEVARRAVILSERYITDRFLPDKAIDLIDEAAAHVMLSCTERDAFDAASAQLEDSKTRLEALESGDAKAESDEERYREIAMLKTEQLRLTEQVDSLRGKVENLPLTVNDLADVIEIWTGIPASSITENEFLRLDKLESRLKQHIIGQDEAVSAAVRAIKRGRAGVTSKRKPVSFIFAGPTGVGKTELVKRLAADLFSSPDALIRVDMTEYMEKHAVSRLIGA